jgi:hypothetical protein
MLSANNVDIDIENKNYIIVFINNNINDIISIDTEITLRYSLGILGLNIREIYLMIVLIGIIIIYYPLDDIKDNEYGNIRYANKFLIISVFLYAFSYFYIPQLTDYILSLQTLVIVFASLYNIELTKSTIDEMRESRKTQTRPHIIVDIDLVKNKPGLNLRIKNIGNGVAYDVKILWTPDLVSSDGLNYSKEGLYNNINYMPPDKEIITLFDSISYFENESLPRLYEVSVNYNDEEGKVYMENYIINLSIYTHVSYISRGEIKDIVRELRKIREQVEGGKEWDGVVRNIEEE